MTIFLVFLLILLMTADLMRRPFNVEPHIHIEVTEQQNQPPTRIASGKGSDGTAELNGLHLTTAVGAPKAIA